MEETWRDVPSLPGYQASTLGRIRSLDRMVKTKTGYELFAPGRVLKARLKKHGYLQLKAGGRWWVVHRLVLLAFAGPCPAGCEGAHNDGDRTNNRPENLRWATRRENHADKAAHGTAQRGERHGCAKLTAENVAEMRSLWPALPYSELVSRFGISMSQVSRIIRRQSWA